MTTPTSSQGPLDHGVKLEPRVSETSALPDITVVGLGAPEESLPALEAFFASMTEPTEPTEPREAIEATDPSIAFVWIRPLAFEREAVASTRLRQHVSLPIVEIEDGMLVRAGYVYVAPDHKDVALVDGRLRLSDPVDPIDGRMPIDFFFRSLAQAQRQHAVAIVLSGSGDDGTHGARAIEESGGRVLVQRPETTTYDGRDRAVLATGQADHELAPEDMLACLVAHVREQRRYRASATSADVADAESVVQKICTLVRSQTRHDFSRYKPSSLLRRIERRMAVHGIDSLEEYRGYLEQSTAEVEGLFRDILIGVTQFFRDPAAFRALEESLGTMLAGRETREVADTVRVWCPGCSTGEEAYSLAIVLHEHMTARGVDHPVRLFATDINRYAISLARTGVYPVSAMTQISPRRLARYFTLEPDGQAYKIKKTIRDMLIFSEQDVIDDPPFSRLDLISCRNLLIYMRSELQRKIMPVFHAALNPGGLLFLGTSESPGETSDLFSTLDRAAKLYRRKEESPGARWASHRRPSGPASSFTSEERSHSTVRTSMPVKQSLRQITERSILQQLSTSGVLVDAQGDILYLHGRTGQFLEPAPGEAGINNVLSMAREGLRHELGLALRQAVETNRVVRCRGLHMHRHGQDIRVHLSVGPATLGTSTLVAPRETVDRALDAPLFLVLFEEAGVVPSEGGRSLPGAFADDPSDESPLDAEAYLAELRRRLQAKEDFLQIVTEQLERSNEELQFSNDEMQTVNEELQSANEELETSKEELCSTNEELATVNADLQVKVTELSRANNDMNNLLAGTGIGTVFVDQDLRILRFTPAVTRILHFIPRDVGRPMAHIASNLVDYDRLVVDTQAVLDTLVPLEKEVRTSDGGWHTMRIQPYRTLDNVVEGAVISFVDITMAVRARDEDTTERAPHG